MNAMLPRMQFPKKILRCISFTFMPQRGKSGNLPATPPPREDNHYPAIIDFYAVLHRTTLTWKEIMDWRYKKKLKKMREDQQFLAERHKILGPDLATTHFITYRGGKVRFCGSNEWVTYEHVKKKKIPSKYTPGFLLEAVDASETKLCYEGFGNFIHLECMKELYLRNCQHVDDFCLNRLYVMSLSLEHLDISGCINVTERGICTLYRLTELKKLVIHNTPRIAHKELTCLMLQDVLPKLEIEGVDYKHPTLLRRLRRYLEHDSKNLLSDNSQEDIPVTKHADS